MTESSLVYELFLGAAAFLSGSLASVAGFGIGGMLTPALAPRLGAKLAVAAVALPHLAASLVRLYRFRREIDRRVLLGFGLLSACGGLAGALLHSRAGGSSIRILFGCLLVLAGSAKVTGLSDRLRFGRRTAWIAGLVSGVFGGLAGAHGGLRAAGLFGFALSKGAFVGTSTAIGVMVDLARTPVYLVDQWQQLRAVWPLVAIATAGTVVGTLAGERLLRRIPERIFQRGVAMLLGALGLVMIFGVG